MESGVAQSEQCGAHHVKGELTSKYNVFPMTLIKKLMTYCNFLFFWLSSKVVRCGHPKSEFEALIRTKGVAEGPVADDLQ